MQRLGPALDGIALGLADQCNQGGEPLRILATKHAADPMLVPRLPVVPARSPGKGLELIPDDNLTAIRMAVPGRFAR